MFRRGVLISFTVMVASLSLPEQAQASPFLTNDQMGYQMFEQKEYQKAADTFEDSRWKGISQYYAGDYSAAADSLK
ncbi:MAG TPA: hypothetical protein DCS35_09035, partial [Vibrio sp.]|nr:hypothetical protein [Vibrio sp.]